MEVDAQHNPISPSKSKTKKSKKKKRAEQQQIENGAGESADLQEPVEKIRATIQVIQDDSTKSPPLIGYFSSGYDPCKNKSSPPSVKVLKNKAKSNRLQVVVKPSGGSNVEFSGTNFSGEAASAQLCRYSLGVLDKETQTLKILPIASNKIFRLEPKVRSSDSSLLDRNSTVTEHMTEEKKRVVSGNYESKAAINRAKRMAELNKEVDPEHQDFLEEKLKNVPIDRAALESTSAHVAQNIPPYDASATTPQEAYPLDKIISRGEWDFLEDIYQLLEEGAEVATDAYPTFVRNRLYKLRDIQDDEERKTLCCIFSYINHLVKFNDLFYMGRFSSAKHHRIPNILKLKFENMFGDPKATKRLPEDKVKLITSYVLVLTLHADGFKTDPTDIAKDLKTSSVDLRQEYERLGCKLSRDTKTSPLLATLPIPIQFSVDIRRKKRRGLY